MSSNMACRDDQNNMLHDYLASIALIFCFQCHGVKSRSSSRSYNPACQCDEIDMSHKFVAPLVNEIPALSVFIKIVISRSMPSERDENIIWF